MRTKLAVLVMLGGALPLAAQQTPAADTGAATATVLHDCLRKCPEGVRPPQFAFFPQIDFTDADAGVRGTNRMRTFLTFQAVVGADGVLEPETVQVTGGSARSAEAELRRGLAQSRFRPGTANGVPVRTRVTLRFDFEAEGVNWVKYTYRVAR
jgi:hypothetical protein